MNRLDVENNLFENDDERIFDIYIDGELYQIRRMNLMEYASIIEYAQISESEGKYTSEQKKIARCHSMALSVIYCLVDDDGKKIFTINDLDKLSNNADSVKMTGLYQEIMSIHTFDLKKK